MSRTFPPSVVLREVGPRDGFQSLSPFIPTERKVEVIRAAAAAGVGEIEATSFVSPKVAPQMQDAAEVLAATQGAGFVRCALAPNPKGAERAIAAGTDKLAVFVSASEAHNQANVRRSVADSLDGLESIFEAAAGAATPVVGAIAVSFGCPYEGDVSPGQVLAIMERFRRFGADEFILGDTTGMATPPRVEAAVKAIRDRFPDVRFSLHFHNNRGTAMTNLYAALGAGATVFDTAFGGIGGCPTVPQATGNLATEDVVYLLDELGIETGIDLGAAIRAARLVEEVLGTALPGQLMKSGPRAPSPSLARDKS